MRRTLTLLALGAVLTTAACQRPDSIWFVGDFEAASAAARERDTVVMVEFQTDWCSWCRRMENDTFAASEVRQRLQEMVVLRLDAEGDGEELARIFGVDSYPTIVFTDGDGEEIDRIIGYLPPVEFLAQTEQIRAGDTFVACLQRLKEDPADADAIFRAVAGLLERSDPEGAISRIKAFHAAGDDHDHSLCKQLMFKARAALQGRVYGRAAKLYRRGWDGSLRAPETDGTKHLHLLLGEDFQGLDPDDQADLLRRARYEDAGVLLNLVSLDNSPVDELWAIGGFAFRNGHYDTAAAAYERWFEGRGEIADSDILNAAAWHLYLADRSTEAAVEIARRSWETDQSADVADTLARLLYITGKVDEAVELQRRAIDMASDAVEAAFREVLKLMEAGQELGDRPSFESFPQGPQKLEPVSDTTVI